MEVSIDEAWYFVYAVDCKHLSVYQQHATVMRAFNRLIGGVFVGFAGVKALAREYAALVRVGKHPRSTKIAR